MKVLFDADAVHYPLTGIGRYIQELSQHLLSHTDIEEIYFYQRLNLAKTLKITHGVTATLKNHERIKNSGLARLVYQALSSQYLRLKLKKIKPTLYHAPNFIIKKLSLPSVATIHDFSFRHHPEYQLPARVAYLNKYLPKTVQHATHLITDSDFVKNELIQFYPAAADKVTAIPLGVDRRFQPQTKEKVSACLKQYGLRYRGFVLSVSTIEPRKNIANLIKAYASLRDELKREYPLVLVGHPGWMNDHVHDEIATLQRNNTLYYLDYVPEKSLLSIYASARCFVYPSFYEGFGLPVLEAMASGTPVVASHASSLAEVSGAAALLVDPYQIAEIAAGIELLCTSDLEWQRYKALGERHAATYSWESCALKTYDVYRKIQSL